MEDKIYIKRSCFALKGMFDIAQLRSTLSENKIKDIALYKNEKFNFIIVDFDINYDEIDIKQMLKEKLNKGLKNNNIQYIKNSKRVFKKNHDQPHYLRDGSIFKRLVMNLEIKNDASLLKEYIEVHKPENIWTEIIENMDTMGIADMEIYLSGFDAFLMMDTERDFDMEKDGKSWALLPREAEWQEYVSKFQKVDPTSKALEKWKIMQNIQIS